MVQSFPALARRFHHSLTTMVAGFAMYTSQTSTFILAEQPRQYTLADLALPTNFAGLPQKGQGNSRATSDFVSFIYYSFPALAGVPST
jgi:hypothetical protein